MNSPRKDVPKKEQDDLSQGQNPKKESRVKAVFDSTKGKTHGAHGIGCRN